MLIRKLGAVAMIVDAIPWPQALGGVDVREMVREAAGLARHPVLLYRFVRSMLRAGTMKEIATGPVYPWLVAVLEEMRRSPDWPAFVRAFGEPDDLELRTTAQTFEAYRDEARARLYRTGIRLAVAAGGSQAISPEPKN